MAQDANEPAQAEVLAALAAYESSVAEGKPEAQVDEKLEAIIEMVPHARITDLYFWGERDRTNEEIVEEALLREGLWREGGDLAVLLRIHGQMKQVADDPDASELHRDSAAQGLADILAEIENLKGATTQ